MSDSYTERPERISAKPGDIFVTRAKSCSSLLIRVATLSKWSHVGIAVNSESVLEAVKAGSTTAAFSPQVRVVPIKVFAANTSAMRHYIRPDKLTISQIEKLNSFVNSNNEKRYTALHAALTAFIPIMALCFGALAVISTFDSWIKAESSVVRSSFFWLAVPTINAIIYFMYRLLAWSVRSDWGVKATENIFRKTRLGRWLVDIKYEMFCSKLVMLAENEIGGHLVSCVPKESEVQPKHIAKACEKLGWRPVDVSMCKIGETMQEDKDLDRLIEELEKDNAEIDKLTSELDRHFDWLDVLSELEGISNKFVSNMSSLSSIYKSISSSVDNNFLIGTLWCGVISAYEGFVHDLFDLLLSKKTHSQEAIKKMQNLDKNLKHQIKLKRDESPSIDELRSLFKKATLNNPNKGADLANHLFNTNIPKIDKSEIENVLRIRNAYAHNNGGISVSISSLERFHGKIDAAVSDYINDVLRQASNHLSTE